MSEPLRSADVAKLLVKDPALPADPETVAEWPEPQPLPDSVPPVQAFDPLLMPSSLRGWIVDIAERVQCPIDYVAVGAMIAVAAVVGRRVGIRPKQQDDWLVVPNLWSAIIGRPGIMKTPALTEVLKPIKRMEVEAKEEHERAVGDFATAKLVDQIRRKEHQKKIAMTIRKGGDPHVLAEELFGEELQSPVRTRYIVNDSTVEKIGVLLNENPNGFLCYRDELVGLLSALDREGQEGARQFYLEAWGGAQRFTYDRIGRGTLDIEACCLSILGGIQPGPLSQYLRAAIRGGRGDDGLLQRFQLAVWPDPPREWRNVDRWPDREARDRAYAVYQNLCALDVTALGVKQDGFDVEGIPYLRFAADAQDQFDDWRGNLEFRLRSGDLHPAIEAHLAKYRSLVPSLALLIHLAEDCTGPVSASALDRALGWATYLESHARRIYSMVSCANLTAAGTLAKKLQASELRDGFALRDVYRHGWAGLTDRDEALSAVQVLEDHDWLVVTRESTAGAPRNRHWVNPKIYKSPRDGPDITDTSPPK